VAPRLPKPSRGAWRAVLLAVVAGGLATAGAAPARAETPYPGTRLNPPGASIVHTQTGPAFIRIYCPGEIWGDPVGYCTGTLTLTWRGRVLSVNPMSSGDYDGPSIEARLPAWFRRAVRSLGPQAVSVAMRTHDGQGVWATTGGTVTISTPPNGPARGNRAPPLPSVVARIPPQPRHVPTPPRYDSAPEFVTQWGNPGDTWDCQALGCFGGGRQRVGGDRQYRNPASVAIDGDGFVYVADNSNNRIQVFSSGGAAIRSLGSHGFDPGSSRRVAARGRFNNPMGLAIAGGAVFVADQRNDRGESVTLHGWFLHRFGRRGSRPARFVAPYAAATSGDEVLFVDQGNYRIERFSRSGRYLGQFGRFGDFPGGFVLARGIAVSPLDGSIYVSDLRRAKILVFTRRGRFKFEFGTPGTGPGDLHEPLGIDFDARGRLYVANSLNRRVERFSANGEFLDLFGWGGYTSRRAGMLDAPTDVAVNRRTGEIYVTDDGNVYARSAETGVCGRFRQPEPDPCRARKVVKYLAADI
jgi:DNA-binding beta-propeller fold protein YncE